VVNCRHSLFSLPVTFVVMLIVVFKIDPPLSKKTCYHRSLLSSCSSLLSCRLLYLKLPPCRCTTSFDVVAIVRWLPAELTTEGIMLIVVFLNCPPLPSLGRCCRCLMSSFTFDFKGLDGRQRLTHNRWINADFCILIFPPFPKSRRWSFDVVLFDRRSFLFDIAVFVRCHRSP
jgi:hypothetical protein